MKKLALILALAAALSTTGCANMSPQDRANIAAGIGGALLGAAAVAGAVYDARHPQPVYVVQPIRVCNRWGRCWYE